jgi:hypothetical protein
MSTEEWAVGYDEGYMNGWNDAMNEKPAEHNEPVAYIEHHKAGDNLVWDNPGGSNTPLFQNQPQRKPLTDEQIEQVFKKYAGYGGDDFISFARAIEAAHGIKENT